MRRLSRWQPLVREATSDAELVRIMRDFVGTLTEGEVAQLPPECRPRDIRTREDISTLAVELARTELTYPNDDDVKEVLTQLAAVFAEATTRLSQMSWEARLLRPSINPDHHL